VAVGGPAGISAHAGLVAALAAPLAGLALLLARPDIDHTWEHHPSHFWLVLTSAAVAAVLAYATGAAAAHRGDARVLLVSVALLAPAGFLGLHALATPGVLLSAANPGFVVATPFGILLGSVAAAWSARDLEGPGAVSGVAQGRLLRLAVVVLMLLWAGLSLGQLPPFDGIPDRAEQLPLLLAVPTVVLYGVAAGRYFQLWHRRRTPMLLAMAAAFVLLAEAMVAIAFAPSWRLSWWEWHVLMLTAFALIAGGARASWREERFADLYLPDTAAGDREISVLFVDLQGFTTWSEQHRPDEVRGMLNSYFDVAIPAVTAYGGEVDRIIGDALMVTFNKRGDQPNHARRAAAAGLALQEATGRVADRHPTWPRFRAGINSGPVSVSLLGTAGGRTHTVIGDTVNTASRLEGKAPAGGVAIGPGTKEQLPDAVTTSLGLLDLKGKAEPVEAHLLLSLGDQDAQEQQRVR
jgi:class 3 adenylate cyclase